MLSILRLFPPELSHFLALTTLQLLYKLRVLSFFFKSHQSYQSVTLNSLIFPNRLGIAAGLDKNGDYFNALGMLGFGFIEVGTITPRPQSGNPKPRIWRISNSSVINALGFNNKGVDHLVGNLKKRNFDGILGVNIGANKDSDQQQRINDYVYCFEKVAPYADYITVNISSPNTPGLRNFHKEEEFETLISTIASTREKLLFTKPVFIKISPDEDCDTIRALVLIARARNFDGFVATNTTVSRNLVADKYKNLPGGLSGELLKDQSNMIVKQLANLDSGTIIGVGGVSSKDDFDEKLMLGASLVQIYTGFIYQGPSIIKKILGQLD